MSSFQCEHCGANILDGCNGYYTGCEHYPLINNMITDNRKRYKATKHKKEGYIKPTLADVFPP